VPDDLTVYLHERPGCQFLQFADFLMNKALAEHLAPNAPERALELLLTELRTVCVDLNEFVLGYMHAVLLHRVDSESPALAGSERYVSNAPSAVRKRLPYFIQLP